MMPMLNQQVKHRSGAQKVGIVTAIITRSSGVQYGVTWDDLTERWHAADEIEPHDQGQRAIGLPTQSDEVV
jgi:hypothetical protein